MDHIGEQQAEGKSTLSQVASTNATGGSEDVLRHDGEENTMSTSASLTTPAEGASESAADSPPLRSSSNPRNSAAEGSSQLDMDPVQRWSTDDTAEMAVLEEDGESMVDVADTGVPSAFRGMALPPDDGESSKGLDSAKPQEPFPNSGAPRPPMRHMQFRPPPVQQPPPPPGPPPPPLGAPDSLSIAQLRRIVADMPQAHSSAYAFEFEDTASFPEELEEWFSYQATDHTMFDATAATFAQEWDKLRQGGSNSGSSAPETELRPWTSATSDRRKRFVGRAVSRVEAPKIETRVEGLESLLYVALGAWKETAGLKSKDVPIFMGHGSPGEIFRDSSLQLRWIIKGTRLIQKAIGIPVIFDALRVASSRAVSRLPEEGVANGNRQGPSDLELRELNLSLTLMYFVVESGRHEHLKTQKLSIRDDVAMLNPNILTTQIKTLAKLRWKESGALPITKFLLLFWKCLLLTFGTSADLKNIKDCLTKSGHGTSSGPEKPIITASPLDYHMFRQEITSKYPAYNPPKPLIALELENTSILPPVSRGRSQPSNGPYAGISSNGNQNGTSILQQPVHIATPAPSPPPSPAGPGGKAGKKQNYQTNQNFPFLYPPLDASSNMAGGKGGPAFQQSSVSRKWEGSDIPESILEAGELFSKRTRMSRSTRQLWEERERYMRYDRGWHSNEANHDKSKGGPLVSDLSSRLKGLSVEGEHDVKYTTPAMASKPDGPLSATEKRGLDAVDDFYRHNLSFLQSLVIVLLKEVLANVTFIVNHPSPWTSNSLGPAFQENGSDGNAGRFRFDSNRQGNGGTGQDSSRFDVSRDQIEALDAARLREISAKAVSGTLLTLLKWFKVSHVLKHEFLTQLLLDSNYLPLILKLFAHQDIDRVIDSQTEQHKFGFFSYCLQSSHQKGQMEPEESVSEDDAVPPPIKLNRNDSQSSLPNKPPAGANRWPPEVDELGYPTSGVPYSPITSFSWRNFYSTINYLRIMQKIVRHKTHRNLLLVHYKSSTILRKLLKVPQRELRLYTLKLFKGQVPYCGRKWRQSNMRVITAVYLHVAPELRDDWLAGGDVDAEVEDALPLEQALRALTHWWHCFEYSDQMGADETVLEGDMDFFARELDKMDWGLEDGAEEMAREEWESTAPLVEG